MFIDLNVKAKMAEITTMATIALEFSIVKCLYRFQWLLKMLKHYDIVEEMCAFFNMPKFQDQIQPHFYKKPSI